MQSSEVSDDSENFPLISQELLASTPTAAASIAPATRGILRGILLSVSLKILIGAKSVLEK